MKIYIVYVLLVAGAAYTCADLIGTAQTARHAQIDAAIERAINRQ